VGDVDSLADAEPVFLSILLAGRTWAMLIPLPTMAERMLRLMSWKRPSTFLVTMGSSAAWT